MNGPIVVRSTAFCLCDELAAYYVRRITTRQAATDGATCNTSREVAILVCGVVDAVAED